MAIDLSKFVIDERDPAFEAARIVCNELSRPLAYKIRNSLVCAKGIRKFPTKDITRFVVRTVGGNSLRPTGGLVEPVWDSKEPIKEGDVVLDLLPLIAYGVPSVVMLSSQLLSKIVRNNDMSITLRPNDVKRRHPKIDCHALDECSVLLDNMLINVLELASEESLQCAEQICMERMNGVDRSAASLLSMVNTSDLLVTSYMLLADVMSNDIPELGPFAELHDYKLRKGGRLSVTNTERVCVSLTCIWLMHLLSVLYNGDFKFEDEIFLEIFNREFFKALGNDEIGTYIRTGVVLQMKMSNGGVVKTRNQLDNDLLFEKLYGCKLTTVNCGDMHIFNNRVFSIARAYYKQVGVNSEIHSKSLDKISEVENERDVMAANVREMKDQVEKFQADVESVRSEYEQRVKMLQYSNDVLRNRVQELEEELSMFKSDLFMYYSDDKTESDESTAPKMSMEERVDLINSFNVLVCGGEASFGEKISKCGVTSVSQYYDTTRMPVGNKYDFYCICSKHIAHKSVFFLQSHFDINGKLFYFNGTNAEMFIRAASDFISNWFDV